MREDGYNGLPVKSLPAARKISEYERMEVKEGKEPQSEGDGPGERGDLSPQ